jgi:hypothetical protein
MTAAVIHVVMWSYADNSSFGIVRAFRHKEDADDLMMILRAHADRTFSVVPTDLIDEVLP